MKKEEIIKKLMLLYPDKRVTSLSTQHRKLYNSAKEKARRKGVSFGDLLSEWGFEFCFGGLAFDPAIAVRLHNEFNVAYQRFSDWTGYSKQMISYLITGYLDGSQNKNEKLGDWLTYAFSEEACIAATEMVTNKQFTHSKGGIRTVLGNNGSGQVYLIVIEPNSISVHFQDTIPGRLMSQIQENRMDVLSEKEVSFVRMGSFVSVMLSQHFIPHESMQQAFYAAAFKKGMSTDEFSVYLTGCKCALAFDKTTDERIVRFLKANDVGGKVYISSHPANQWVRSLAYRRNVRLNELVEIYGFKLADKGFSKRNPSFLRQSSNDTGLNGNYTTTMEEKQQILKNLENLKGRNGRKRKVVNVPLRNNDLNGELKRLYDYKCQLCDEESKIPPIIKSDGKPFITVHHFSAISGVSDIPDDSTEILDRAENIIVCCAHHHSFLENHGGGFREAYKDSDGTVWLRNKNGERVPLVTNYHFLKSDESTSQGNSLLCEKEVV